MSRAHTPIIVEISGLPASGKTTAALSVKSKLEGSGASAIVIQEAAGQAPFPPEYKLNWRFNAWTLCQSVSELVRVSSGNDNQYIIFDRGVFDSICWLRWFEKIGQIDREVGRSVYNFATIPSWFKLIRFIFLLTVPFQTAVARHGGSGRIVNRRTFTELHKIYKAQSRRLMSARRFSTSITLQDSSQCSAEEIAASITRKILRIGD